MTDPTDPRFAGGADLRPGSDFPVQADIPARPVSRARRGGLFAGVLALLGLIAGNLKYLLVLLKFGKFGGTLISIGLTTLVYAQFFGWAFAAGLALLILIHETGHLVVARRLGIPTTMPILIPFLGAFVAMRQAPKTVAQESQMAIGGPILGSIGAAVFYLGAQLAPDSWTGKLLLVLAFYGILINLFNLIPVTPLDGGRVLSVLSKWFNVAGLAIAVGLFLFSPLKNPVLLLVIIFGVFSTFQRFRSTTENPAYFEVPAQTKWTIGALYLGLLIALAIGFEYTHPAVAGLL